jgi:hypothetical protein
MRRHGIHKAMGAILLPYHRIGGHLTFPPALIAHAQVDGSYGRGSAGRVAAILTSDTGYAIHRKTQSMKAISATETEWAAIALGLELALQHGQTAVGIENDCLGVIQALMFPDTPLKHAYARHWRSTIQRLAEETHWTGVRWIPHEVNQADGLLR